MGKAICTVDECERSAEVRGWCRKHYRRWQRHGDPEAGARGDGTGSRYVFVYAPDHPLTTKSGWMLEHRRVAWDTGILTDPAQHVHHKNGDRRDNRPENLEAVEGREHGRRHALERWQRQRAAGIRHL